MISKVQPHPLPESQDHHKTNLGNISISMHKEFD